MKFIADFHIHSRFSRATSRELCPEELDYWARLKGLSVVGAGDFTHPGWFSELKEKLEPAENGLYRLKENLAIKDRVLPPEPRPVRFMLSAEISCIYKKAGAVRKLHHLILSPGLEAAEAVSKKLSRIGNLASDGRPILGLDSKNLLEIVLEHGAGSVLIPAHVWTPWFSLFGSMSGFDSVRECFEDLEKEIFALETGLSSDPAMNRRLSALDRFSLVSNSDAHSAKNLAREGNLFNCELDYNQMIAALRFPEQGFLGTVEFFPEEGKYHFDGHRKCEVRLAPEETRERKGLCPVCGKPVTVGVMSRVEALADRPAPEQPASAPGFKSLIPLREVIGEILGCGAQSKSVEREYFRLVKKLGPETDILMEIPETEIEKEFPVLGEAVRRMREGRVIVKAGYDGEYGIIRVFEESELKKLQRGQAGFFAEPARKKPARDELEEPPAPAARDLGPEKKFAFFPEADGSPEQAPGLEPAQEDAVECRARALLIKAGPGTGKTRTLTRRIARVIASGEALPGEMLALTFTNQAGQEMRSRLLELVGEVARGIFTGTFHGFAWKLIRESGGKAAEASIIDEDLRRALLAEAEPGLSKSQLKKAAELIRRAKMFLLDPEAVKKNSDFPDWLPRVYRHYQEKLRAENCFDFDDLIFLAGQILKKESAKFKWIFVDEYQDLDFAQYQMVKLLAGKSGSLCVIGDPHQAIYGFRGASAEFFNRFQEDFPDAKIMELKRSFRSSEQILEASAQALEQPSEKLCSGINGSKLRIIELASERAEAEFVVHEIEKLVGGTGFFSFDSARVRDQGQTNAVSFGDIGVLFRASSQIPSLVEAFSRSGIPYGLLSESPLLSRFWKAGLRVLRMIAGGASPLLLRIALKEIFPEGDVPAEPARLKKWLAGSEDSRAKILLKLMDRSAELSALEICGQAFALAACAEGESAEKEMAREFALELVKRKAGQEGIKTPEQVMQALAFASAQDFYDPNADRVSLLTIHSAKGLEFEVVFVVGCEEGIIPHISARTESEIEEERRLFYVALTRAKSLLYLSRAKKRASRGAVAETTPSRFLARISRGLLDKLKPEPFAAKPKSPQLGLFEK